mmetsp:Transcript_9651/g.43905  ORF Transcript_9651/g.43905 Transcript_9651/m.43905 type:complete len:345 (+) Transcript_9651:1742-2776(+)
MTHHQPSRGSVLVGDGIQRVTEHLARPVPVAVRDEVLRPERAVPHHAVLHASDGHAQRGAILLRGNLRAAHPVRHGVVQTLQTKLHVPGHQAAVRKDGVVDDQHRAVHRELLRQGPAGGEQAHTRLDLLLPRVILAAAESLFKRGSKEVHEVLAEPHGLLKRTLRDVPEVPGDVEDLVVTVEDVHRAALRLGLLVELLEEDEDGDLVVAPIEDVANLHHDGVSTGPLGIHRVAAVAEDAGDGEGAPGLADVAVDVAEGDDAAGRGHLEGRVGRLGVAARGGRGALRGSLGGGAEGGRDGAARERGERTGRVAGHMRGEPRPAQRERAHRASRGEHPYRSSLDPV